MPREDWIEDEIKYSWLNLGQPVHTLDLQDNLGPITDEDVEYPGLAEMRLLSDPAYIGYACKVFLGIDLLPEQMAILGVLFEKQFPIFLATRGAGKAQPLASQLLTTNGWKQMGQIKVGDRIYGRDGKAHSVTGVYPQGKQQLCRLTLADGRQIDCCKDHLWLVRHNGKEIVISTKDIISHGVKYENQSFAYKFKIPNCEPIQYENATDTDLPIDPYVLGYLLGNGCLTTGTIKVATDDEFVINEFKYRLPGFKIARDVSNNNYTIVDQQKILVKNPNKTGQGSVSKRNRMKVWTEELGLDVGCKSKFIPEIYKHASVIDRMELIRGLLDSDGSITIHGAIEFTNTCKQLVSDIVDILRSLGIACRVGIDDRSDALVEMPSGNVNNRPITYRIYINTSQKVFKLPRKRERIKSKPTNVERYTSIVSAEYLDQYEEMQCISVDSPDHTYITTDYIVTHNTFLLAIYTLMRLLLAPPAKDGGPGAKVIVAGSGFRQSKLVFAFMETLWRNGSVYRSVCDNQSGLKKYADRWEFHVNGNVAWAIPIGSGNTIRGYRATDVICDEFDSINREIYEVVIQPFASTTLDPIENVKKVAKKQTYENLGIPHSEDLTVRGNKIILSGTCGWGFGSFAEYWRRYRSIIRGDKFKAEDDDPLKQEDDLELDRSECAIIRVPFELIPKGMMDESVIARAKATVHSSIYAKEFGTVFPQDSEGFFKRTMIEGCVTSDMNPIDTLDGSVWFDAAIRGNPSCRYVMGVDPASEGDNFAIVVLEVHPNHRRVVYCWTTNRQQFEYRKRVGLTDAGDYYGFCARKIRELMIAFPLIEHHPRGVSIAVDILGGGIALMEALHDKDKLREGEQLIWASDNVAKPGKYGSSTEPGIHIIDPIAFGDYAWLTEANHGMKKDMEEKVLLFPRYDSVTLELAFHQESERERKFEKEHGKKLVIHDSLEQCVEDIEELKDELTSIEWSTTASGRERWDVPTGKVAGNKGYERVMKKDRYSALLMANMIAREIARVPTKLKYDAVGGSVFQIADRPGGELYTGPQWFKDRANQALR